MKSLHGLILVVSLIGILAVYKTADNKISKDSFIELERLRVELATVEADRERFIVEALKQHSGR